MNIQCQKIQKKGSASSPNADYLKPARPITALNLNLTRCLGQIIFDQIFLTRTETLYFYVPLSPILSEKQFK